MGKHQRAVESLIHGIFLVLGLITVGCVLLITAYLVLSGIPAVRQIGLFDFLLGDTWESTAKEPSFGILPFIMTSIYGTAGAILLGVPAGFLTAVYLAKLAPLRVKTVVESAVSLALYFYSKEPTVDGASVSFAIAAILMVLTLAINLTAVLVGRYFKKRRAL